MVFLMRPGGECVTYLISMRLDTEFIQIPLLFDAPLLACEVAGFSEQEWQPHPRVIAATWQCRSSQSRAIHSITPPKA